MICVGIAVLFNQNLLGQTNEKRLKRIQIEDFIVLDTLTILPHSIEFRDSLGHSVSIPYRLEDNIIYFDSITQQTTPTIDVLYYTLPFHIGQSNQLIDSTKLSSKSIGQYSFYDYKVKNNNNNNIFGSKGLDYDGSFSRGISFGNAQDLIYDAAFNLQMSGTIGDGISLKAAISDNQIPIQPEGNTQQIQEFDKIFIEISKNKHSLLAGDFNVLPQNGYFTQYKKKLKGLSYSFQSEKGNVKISNKTSAAISRGRFNRQALDVTEGNQGPYKLIGKQGERFIIVIAGIEKVYVDGRIIHRGEDRDYVMDYNLGEISFTTNMPITNNSRVFVEFEYLDQQYSRSLITHENTFEWKNIKSYINVYHQQDSKRPSINFGTELDSATLSILQNLPESSGKLFVPGTSKAIENSQDQLIKYEMRDTFYKINGVRKDTNILYYSEHTQSTNLYTSKFSELGSNGGDYILKKSSINGRIYQWVAPDSISGLPNGNYSPVVSITPPSIHQVIEGGVKIDILDGLSINTEFAMSRKDLNRYSAKYEDNDIGSALLTVLNYKKSLSNSWQLKANMGYEYKNENFSIIEPYRDSEFNRNWNINSDQAKSEHLPSLELSLYQNKGSSISYNYQGLFRSDNYRGNKHHWSGTIRSKGWTLSSLGSILDNKNSFENSSYIKPSFRVQNRIAKLRNTIMGLSGYLEQNLRKDVLTDTLLASSFYFYELSPFIQNDLHKKLNIMLKYTIREDKIARFNDMALLSRANNFIFSTSWKPSPKTNISSSLNYRSLLVHLKNDDALKDTKTLLGKTILNTHLLKGALRWTTKYEVSSGQEPKSEFVFTEVQSGEGNYIFNDFNQDGVAQFNEYILAPYGDTANYIKLRLFNNEFIRTDHVNLEQSIVIDPRKTILKQKTTLSPWYNWMIRSTFKSSKKTTAASITDAWNPFSTAISNSNLILNLTSHNIQLILRPSDEIYDFQFKHSQRSTKQLLTTGYESQRSSNYIGSFRWNLIKSLDLRMHLGRVFQWSDSQNFDDRDYNISEYQYQAMLNYRWRSQLRFALSYELQEKENTGIEAIQAQIQNLKLETTIKQSNKHSFNVNMTFAQVEYDGIAGTSLELVLLNGLKSGNNYIWNVRYDRKLTNSIFMNISYNGRKTGEARIFHTGNIQMRAIF